MRFAFWPGLGGGPRSLVEVEPVLADRGIDTRVVDPQYEARNDWRLEVLANELAATNADVYGGHSWGGAVAAVAAATRPPRALVLLDGGHLGPQDFAKLGAAATTDERVAEIRREHAGYRWASVDEYLAFCRESSPRWNPLLEESALDGMREQGGEVLPPFDSDRLEQIVRGYEAYDPTDVLPRLDPGMRVLLVAASADDEHAAARGEAVERFTALATGAQVERVESGHDVIWGLGPALGTLIADWLEAA